MAISKAKTNGYRKAAPSKPASLSAAAKKKAEKAKAADEAALKAMETETMGEPMAENPSEPNGPEDPVAYAGPTAVPSTELQIVNELRDLHSKWVKNEEKITEMAAELKELKQCNVKHEARRLRLLNQLSGVEPLETQGNLPLAGQVMDMSNVTTPAELENAADKEDSDSDDGEVD